jgi:hypothetical protein
VSATGTTRCPTCGSVRFEFDPPIPIETGRTCGAILAANYATTGTLTTVHGGQTVTREGEPPPHCIRREDHDGEHIAWVERLVRWSP